MKLSKSDVRKAMARYHFAPATSPAEVFDRLRSIQFDPIAPVGCNHDLVLQSRLADYRIGDWQKTAYQDRLIYDGWDKQASLVPFEGWPARRIFHTWHRPRVGRVFDDHPYAVEAVLKELTERGPLMPKELEFQERKEEWKDSWHGPNLSKQTLRALWHTGQVMTAGRKNGHHIYDLTERVVPPQIFQRPALSEAESLREMLLDRHRGVGLLRPNAAQEVWSFYVSAAVRRAAIQDLVGQGDLVAVEVEGVKAHAAPALLKLLDEPALEPRVVFVAPLDQFVWDRGMVAHLFDFDYVWEIYVPEAKRRWGYYVLPVLFGDRFVARVEFWARKGVLEIRNWHWEPGDVPPAFFAEFERTLRQFMAYSSTNRVDTGAHIDPRIADVARSL